MRKIAIINAKGGVGKTTTSVNLAAGLAVNGKKVLLVDTDPQGHVAVCLNVPVGQNSLAELLRSKPGTVDVKDYIQNLRPNLDGVLSDSSLEEAIRYVSAEPLREFKLKKLMKEVNQYDFVVFDCAPGLTLMNQNVLFYCDEVMIPVSMEFLALHGLKELESQLELAQDSGDHDIKISFIVPTMYDARNKKSSEVIEVLSERFGRKVSKPIRINTKLSEAAAARQTIYEYDVNSPGAQDYATLTLEVLEVG